MIKPICAESAVKHQLTNFHILRLQFLPPPSSLASVKSRMETFWYRLTQVVLEKWILNEHCVF